MIQMLPIILMYLILFIAVLSIFFIIAKIKIKKLGYWMLGGYMSILLIFFIVYLLIPVEELSDESDLTVEEMHVDMMHKVAYRGLAIEEFDEYKINEWEFDVDSEESTRLDTNGDYYNFPVVIEKVSDATNISAALYHVEPEVELEPISGGINPVHIRIVNKDLMIELPGPSYYYYAQLSKEFPFTQFSDSEGDYFRPPIYTGEYLLYLKVPEQQELLIDPNINYEYLD